MKANDLRIGNWVQYDGILYQIESLTKVDAVVCSTDIFDFRNRSLEKAQPIELTEKVLEKIVGVNVVDLDYNKTGLKGTNYHFNDCMVSLIYKGGKYHTKLISSKYNISLDVKYLHQLQNAYYCLTGQELEVNL